MKWPCVMIDLETLSTGPDARVLEVGAVCFDRRLNLLGPRFHAEVLDVNGAVDSETFRWWMERQKEGVRMPGMELTAATMAPSRAVWNLAGFLEKHWDGEKGTVWSWGIDFDLVILRGLISRGGWPLEWKYWQQRDARTVCAEAGVKREGKVEHRALEDAVQEAWAVLRCGMRSEKCRVRSEK